MSGTQKSKQHQKNEDRSSSAARISISSRSSSNTRGTSSTRSNTSTCRAIMYHVQIELTLFFLLSLSFVIDLTCSFSYSYVNVNGNGNVNANGWSQASTLQTSKSSLVPVPMKAYHDRHPRGTAPFRTKQLFMSPNKKNINNSNKKNKSSKSNTNTKIKIKNKIKNNKKNKSSSDHKKSIQTKVQQKPTTPTQNKPPKRKPSTMDTALCIIPPNEAWDDIQRARHIAHDPSFYSWPPAIRLFHPFIPKSHMMDDALVIAELVEKYDIEPFNVTLDHLLILPHLELIEEMEEDRKSLPTQMDDENDDDDDDEAYDDDENDNNESEYLKRQRKRNRKKMTKEEKEVHELIKSEERKGRQKLEKRLEREREKKKRLEEQKKQQMEMQRVDENKNEITDPTSESSSSLSSQPPLTSSSDPTAATHDGATTTTTTTTSATRITNPSQNQKSPRQILAEQQKSKTQFNGPCVLCLEPDEESQIHLQTLREILRKKIFYDYDPFSASSTLPRGTGGTPAIGGSSNSSNRSSRRGNGGKALAQHSHINGSVGISGSGIGTDDGSNRYNSQLPKSILEKHGLLPHQRDNTSRREMKKREGSTYRPLIVLGQFSTVTKAVDVARRLQKLWDPLTFHVGDLQLVSTTSNTKAENKNILEKYDKSGANNGYDDDEYDDYEYEYIRNRGYNQGTQMMDNNNNPILSNNREYDLRKRHGTTDTVDFSDLTSNGGEYGCDAMIMLMGEEEQLLQPSPLDTANSASSYDIGGNDSESVVGIEQHNGDLNDNGYYLTEEDEDQILDLLMTNAATSGGGGDNGEEGKEKYNASNAGGSFYIEKEKEEQKKQKYKEEIDDMKSDYIEDWLSDDDDYDEGATVVIGRTQFFMGDMRQYTGMPASSTIDGKDKKLGENVSGSARRRGAVHRQGDRWNDGDFGQKEKDMLP